MCLPLLQERYWRISGDFSSADLRRFAAALQAGPVTSEEDIQGPPEKGKA